MRPMLRLLILYPALFVTLCLTVNLSITPSRIRRAGRRHAVASREDGELKSV